MAGQGTMALELLDQMEALNVKLDAIVLPIAGGGMAAGVATVIKQTLPSCKVMIVEPEGKDLRATLKAGESPGNEGVFLNTIAKSIARQPVGNCTFPIIHQLVKPDEGDEVKLYL